MLMCSKPLGHSYINYVNFYQYFLKLKLSYTSNILLYSKYEVYFKYTFGDILTCTVCKFMKIIQKQFRFVCFKYTLSPSRIQQKSNLFSPLLISVNLLDHTVSQGRFQICLKMILLNSLLTCLTFLLQQAISQLF